MVGIIDLLRRGRAVLDHGRHQLVDQRPHLSLQELAEALGGAVGRSRVLGLDHGNPAAG